MKAIIVGAGRVGSALAAELTTEGHDVTVIDTDRHRLENLEMHYNLSVYEGSGARLETLEAADLRHTDLLIAVTEMDELNMVSCFLAKNAGAKSTIARVRNPGYSDFDNEARLAALGIDMIINPERVTAKTLSKLIVYPEAEYVAYFGQGKAQLLELKIPASCPHLDERLMDMTPPAPFIVIGIERNGALLIPRGDAVLKSEDIVLLLADSSNMRKVEAYLGIGVTHARYVVIRSSGLTGYYLAERLETHGHGAHVKVFATDLEQAEEMAAALQHTTIIHAPETDAAFYEDENVGTADVFVSVTNDDKENLFSALLAKSMGAKRLLCQATDAKYVSVMEKAGVHKTITATRLTVDAILCFINRNHVLSLTRFEDMPGQLTEFVVREGARAVDQTLVELDFPHEALVCMISRGEDLIIPRGSDRILAGDTVIVFSRPEVIPVVEALFAEETGD